MAVFKSAALYGPECPADPMMALIRPATEYPGRRRAAPGWQKGHSARGGPPCQNTPLNNARAVRKQTPATTAAAGMVRIHAMRISRTTPHLTAE